MYKHMHTSIYSSQQDKINRWRNRDEKKIEVVKVRLIQVLSHKIWNSCQLLQVGWGSLHSKTFFYFTPKFYPQSCPDTLVDTDITNPPCRCLTSHHCFKYNLFPGMKPTLPLEPWPSSLFTWEFFPDIRHLPGLGKPSDSVYWRRAGWASLEILDMGKRFASWNMVAQMLLIPLWAYSHGCLHPRHGQASCFL